jgi:hypothetical protein
MRLPSIIGSLFTRGSYGPSGEFEAATQLAPVEQPKVRKGPLTLPSYLKTAKPDQSSSLTRTDRRLHSTNIESYRNTPDSRKVIRDYVAASPDLSAAVSAYLRTAITKNFVAVARDLDGKFNKEATALLQQLIVRFDVLGDYKDGFCGIGSLRSNSESLGKELMTYGAMCAELVLDKARLPKKIQPISAVQIEFASDGVDLIPKQNLAGELRDLDIPTFFYVALDQDLLEPYPASPLESALQPVMFSTEFMNDLRKVVKRAIHPRLDVEIDEELFLKNLPADAQHNPEVQREHMNTFLTDLETMINGLKPEDALVHFSSVGIDIVNNGNVSLEAEYETLSNLINSKIATGAKAMPSILGHGSGSQNVASTETLLFTKNAAGMVQEKLNELYSRMLTLAVRLFGYDVYVEFRYGDIDLRPESELEAFRSMKQDRTLALLSLGFISDEEASIDLTGKLPSGEFTPLSGTGFHTATAVDPEENAFSNTSTGGSNGGAANQGPKSKAPKKAKGNSK